MGAHGLARDDLAADGGLHRHVEELAGDEGAEALDQRPALGLRVGRVRDEREGIDGGAGDEDVQLDELGGEVVRQAVVEAGIALGRRFELVVKIEDDLRKRDLVLQHDAGVTDGLRLDLRRCPVLPHRGAIALQVFHPLVLPAARLDEVHHRADVAVRADDSDVHPRLADLRHLGRGWQVGGVVDHDLLAVRSPDLVLNTGRGDQQLQPVLAFQAFLDDLHVEQPKEPTAKPGAERNAGFRLEGERGVVELQLLQRLPQEGVVVRLRRVEPGEDHRFRLLVAGERFRRRALGVCERVADAALAHVLQSGGDIANLARGEGAGRHRARRQVAHLKRIDIAAGGHEAEPVAALDGAVHDSHVGDHALVDVVLRIEDEAAQRRLWVAGRGRDAADDGFEYFIGAGAFLRGGEQHLLRIEADEIADLLRNSVRIGAGQVDLVDDRHDRQIVVEGDVEVRDRLRLDALRRVDDEHGALAGGERARHLVGEIDVAGRIDQVELVLLARVRHVGQPDGLRLDRDALLPLQFHRVKDLFDTLAACRRQQPRTLQEAIGQRRLAVVDVGDDAEVADAISSHALIP